MCWVKHGDLNHFEHFGEDSHRLHDQNRECRGWKWLINIVFWPCDCRAASYQRWPCPDELPAPPELRGSATYHHPLPERPRVEVSRGPAAFPGGCELQELEWRDDWSRGRAWTRRHRRHLLGRIHMLITSVLLIVCGHNNQGCFRSFLRVFKGP